MKFDRSILIAFLFVHGQHLTAIFTAFLHWQRNWHPYRQLVSCYICFVLSLHSGIMQSCCFCVHMWKSCDFECV